MACFSISTSASYPIPCPNTPTARFQKHNIDPPKTGAGRLGGMREIFELILLREYANREI